MLSLLYAAALLVPTQSLAEVPAATERDPRHIAVVCPPTYRAALAPWWQQRLATGWRVSLVAPEADAEGTLEAVRDVARQGQPITHVMLVGDCRLPDAAPPAGDEPPGVPTHYLPSPITEAFGSTATMASDGPYGDLDGDGIPDAAVGRLPVDSVEQLDGLVRRILDFEANRDFGAWRRRVHLVAGVGGFGRMADAAIEAGARSIISAALPVGLRTTVTYASPSSPFFPGAARFRQTIVDRWAEGGLAWVYIGHGHVTRLDRLPEDPLGQPILSTDELDQVLAEHPSQVPIAIMLACLTGAYDAHEDSLAERMVLADGGPVAAIAGSRITLPYGNAALASAMTDAWFTGEKQTIGEVLLAARQHCGEPADESSAQEMMLAGMASLLSPTRGQLEEERGEHALLYNLLGDPSMPIQHPGRLPLEFTSFAAPGDVLVVRGQAEHEGRLTVELATPPGAVTARRDAAGAGSAERYDEANRQAVSSTTREIDRGPFEVRLPVPATARGPMLVRAFLGSASDFSLGGGKLTVVPARQERESGESPVPAATR